MARYRKRDALEARLADELEAEGHTFTVDLTAKRATGIEGYRVTVAFLGLEGAENFFVELEPAESREEAQRRAEALENPERLRSLLAEHLAGPG